MPREPDAPAPAPSAEARRLIDRVIDDALDGPGGRYPDGKAALSAHVAGLEAEVARLLAASLTRDPSNRALEAGLGGYMHGVLACWRAIYDAETAAQRGRAAEGGESDGPRI